jgi:hypothetical protein
MRKAEAASNAFTLFITLSFQRTDGTDCPTMKQEIQNSGFFRVDYVDILIQDKRP